MFIREQRRHNKSYGNESSTDMKPNLWMQLKTKVKNVFVPPKTKIKKITR